MRKDTEEGIYSILIDAPVAGYDYCPEFALEETVEYDIAEYTRDRLVWSPERLSKPPVKKDDKYVFSVDTIGGASQVRQKEE